MPSECITVTANVGKVADEINRCLSPILETRGGMKLWMRWDVEPAAERERVWLEVVRSLLAVPETEDVPYEQPTFIVSWPVSELHELVARLLTDAAHMVKFSPLTAGSISSSPRDGVWGDRGRQIFCDGSMTVISTAQKQPKFGEAAILESCYGQGADNIITHMEATLRTNPTMRAGIVIDIVEGSRPSTTPTESSDWIDKLLNAAEGSEVYIPTDVWEHATANYPKRWAYDGAVLPLKIDTFTLWGGFDALTVYFFIKEDPRSEQIKLETVEFIRNGALEKSSAQEERWADLWRRVMDAVVEHHRAPDVTFTRADFFWTIEELGQQLGTAALRWAWTRLRRTVAPKSRPAKAQ